MNEIYSITEHEHVQVLSITSLLDEWQNRQILKELQYKIDKGINCFVVDLAQLNLVTSVGLNFLLSLFSRSKKNGGSLVLTNVSNRVQQVLDITKLTNVFPIKASVENAVDSFCMELAA